MTPKGMKPLPLVNQKKEASDHSKETSLNAAKSCLSYRLQRTALFSSIIFFGTLIAVFFHFGLGSIQGAGWPQNSFLYTPQDRFMDFVNSLVCVKDLNPYFNNGNSLGVYFPFSYLCLVPFTMMPIRAAVWCFLLSSIFAIILLIVWWCRLRFSKGERFIASRDLLIASLASYPIIFAVDRGNIDIWIGILLLLFLIGLRQNKWGFWLTIPTLAAASGMKGYPTLFLLLLIIERRYVETISVLILSTMLTVGSLAAFDGTFIQNWQGFCAGLNLYDELYVIGTGSFHYSTDPYNGLRFIFGNASTVRFWYGQFSFLFLIMASLFVLFSSVPKWRKMMAVGVTLLIFPNAAADYRLLVLLPGILELMSLNDPLRFRDKATLVLTALLFIPKHYYFFAGSDFSISCIVSPIVVLLISLVLFVDLSAWKALGTGFWGMCKFYLEPVYPLLRFFRRTATTRETN